MAVEVERNFLVTGDERRKAEGTVQRQGHLSTQPERTVRVRIEDDKATLTIKGITRGATRSEYEYDIPPEGARRAASALRAAPHRESAPAPGARRPRLGSGRVPPRQPGPRRR